MKKSVFLLGLLAITSLCLTACDNSKDFTMSFEDAVDTANHSALQDILLNNDNFQQSLDLSTNIDNWTSKITVNLQSNSKQNLENNKSESSTAFDVNIDGEESNILVKWNLGIKLVDNTVYLNLWSLDFSWWEDLSFISAMIEWFKNQWYSIPMEGLSEVPNALSYIKDAKDLDEQTKEIIINDWSMVYNWRFAQFSWYNSWKISLDTEKLQQLINEYYAKVNEALSEENQQDVPQLNIQNFEWYLVITWKDKVTTVIENMDVIEWESNINLNWFWGDDYEINAYSNWESVLTIEVTKKKLNYNISINVANSVLLEWTISPKLSSSKIDIKFDATLTVKSNYEETNDTVLPLKGNWSYNPISDFDVSAPEWAQDLTEILSSYLWNAFWWEEYNLEDYEWDWVTEDLSEELNESVEESIEVE